MDPADIGPYRPGTRLGGSRAVVRVATDVRTGRAVVLKSAPWERPEVVAALAREATILGRVAHPSLVRLLDVVEHVDGRTLVLANASAGDLTRLLAARGAMDATAAAELGAHVAGALAALHDVAVVHRDVRPSNVVLDAELVPVLCDLDHALDPSQPALASDDRLVGDAAHVDPRLFDGLPQGPRMDLFGLGSVVWAAVTGGRPRPADLADAVGSVPTPLLATIGACLDATVGDARAARAAFGAVAVEVREWRRGATVPIGDRTDAGRSNQDAAVAEGGVPDATAPTSRDGSAAPHRVEQERDDRTTQPGAGPAGAARPGPDRRGRAAALAGGGAGTATPTRRWAPPHAPGVLRPADGEQPRRTRRTIAIVAAATVVVGAAAVAAAAAASAPATVDRAPVPAVAPVVPPPLCDGERPPDDHAGDGTDAAVGDVRGAGCSLVLTLDGDVMTTPDGRFRVGRPGDRLLAGDWDGDGRWSPAIHRPGTGEVFLFDDGPSPTGRLVSRPALRFAPSTELAVVATATGTHEVVPAPSGH